MKQLYLNREVTFSSWESNRKFWDRRAGKHRPKELWDSVSRFSRNVSGNPGLSCVPTANCLCLHSRHSKSWGSGPEGFLAQVRKICVWMVGGLGLTLSLSPGLLCSLDIHRRTFCTGVSFHLCQHYKWRYDCCTGRHMWASFNLAGMDNNISEDAAAWALVQVSYQNTQGPWQACTLAVSSY